MQIIKQTTEHQEAERNRKPEAPFVINDPPLVIITDNISKNQIHIRHGQGYIRPIRPLQLSKENLGKLRHQVELSGRSTGQLIEEVLHQGIDLINGSGKQMPIQHVL